MSLYLLEIATISDFPSPPPTACLSTRFRRIVTILFRRRRGVLAHVFLRRAYAPVKQTLSIGNIVHWSSAYQSPLFEPMAQIELRFCPAADSNYPNAPPDLRLQQQAWRIQFLSFFHKEEGKNGRCEVSAQGCNCLLQRRRRI